MVMYFSCIEWLKQCHKIFFPELSLIFVVFLKIADITLLVMILEASPSSLQLMKGPDFLLRGVSMTLALLSPFFSRLRKRERKKSFWMMRKSVVYMTGMGTDKWISHFDARPWRGFEQGNSWKIKTLVIYLQFLYSPIACHPAWRRQFRRNKMSRKETQVFLLWMTFQ